LVVLIIAIFIPHSKLMFFLSLGPETSGSLVLSVLSDIVIILMLVLHAWIMAKQFHVSKAARDLVVGGSGDYR
jgi:hypothetical protein